MSIPIGFNPITQSFDKLLKTDFMEVTRRDTDVYQSTCGIPIKDWVNEDGEQETTHVYWLWENNA